MNRQNFVKMKKKISKSLLIRKMKYEGTINLGCLRIAIKKIHTKINYIFGVIEENSTFEKLGV